MLDEIVVDGSDSNPGFDGSASESDLPSSNDKFNFGNSSDRPTGITDTRVLSDTDPDVVRPGEQYAADERRVGNGQNFDITPGQAARLSIAQSRAEDSIALVREIEPIGNPRLASIKVQKG